MTRTLVALALLALASCTSARFSQPPPTAYSPQATPQLRPPPVPGAPFTREKEDEPPPSQQYDAVPSGERQARRQP
jgi:hypothetical protein